MLTHSETAPATKTSSSDATNDQVLAVSLKIVSGPTNIETIAVGYRIRELKRLRRIYGSGRWRKKKGLAIVRLPDGSLSQVEVHWYEAHGIGRKEFKIKRLV